MDQVLNTQGVKFFDAYLKGAGQAARAGLGHGLHRDLSGGRAGGRAVPREQLGEARTPGRVAFGAGGTQRITSTGGDPDIASAINPIGGKPLCEGLPAARAGGTAVASRRVGKPFTLLGPADGARRRSAPRAAAA